MSCIVRVFRCGERQRIEGEEASKRRMSSLSLYLIFLLRPLAACGSVAARVPAVSAKKREIKNKDEEERQRTEGEGASKLRVNSLSFLLIFLLRPLAGVAVLLRERRREIKEKDEEERQRIDSVNNFR